MEALEDAGIPPPSLGGTDTGVYIATLSNEPLRPDVLPELSELHRLDRCRHRQQHHPLIGSYFLNLEGPSLTLDTACSGSLLAIDFACRSLRAGESSLAIAGGASINLLPKVTCLFARGRTFAHR